jgi:hypothetical protein
MEFRISWPPKPVDAKSPSFPERWEWAFRLATILLPEPPPLRHRNLRFERGWKE